MPASVPSPQRSICVLALLALGAHAALVGLATPARAAEAGSYRLVAHRGFPGGATTENTLAAFGRAFRHGAPAIEVDIRLTVDEELILMHDPTLGRTTTCWGEVSKRAAATIIEKCRGSVNRERIPSLSRALTWAAARHLNMLLEIKRDPAGRWSPEHFARINDLLLRTGMARRARIFSFNDEYLKMAEGVNPDLESHSIVERWGQVAQVRTWADALNVYAGQLTADRVDGLHADGVEVLGRNTNRPESWRRLRKVGVDGLLTDQLSRYRDWARTRRR